MENEFVNYNQALALKELGFDEKSLAYWFNETPLNPEGQCLVYYRKPYDNVGITSGIIREYGWAPLYQQAFKWFREKYKIEATISCFYNKRLDIPYEERQYHCYIIRDGVTSKGPKYKTYEEAEKACLDKLIEICKTK